MDTNRIIKIEELEVGDEMIVSSNGRLGYYRILRKPKMNSKTNKWSGVRCSTKVEVETFTRGMRIMTYIRHICTPEEHNHEASIYGLNYRAMWLVKREI